VTLSGLGGKNVLPAFFPLAFTRACNTEMCAFSEDQGVFRDADAAAG
jgi:peroxiredoxin